MTTQVGPRQVKPGEVLEHKLVVQIGPCRRISLRPGGQLHQQAGCKTATDLLIVKHPHLANGRCPCKNFRATQESAAIFDGAKP